LHFSSRRSAKIFNSEAEEVVCNFRQRPKAAAQSWCLTMKFKQYDVVRIMAFNIELAALVDQPNLFCGCAPISDYE
jgi:hypothetical protein